MPGTIENIKVAVRVRPFNNREKQRNAKCIIKMHEKTTELINPNDSKEKPRKFTFDHSYWSHDGFKNDKTTQPDLKHINGYKYADQSKIYQDIGKPILENALDGYNTALFAYGQTGSGKSYTVVGYGKNKGIVPKICEDLFTTLALRKEKNDKTTYEIRFSMMEIYNEIVKDLCNPEQGISKKGLKVREHPTKGFYAAEEQRKHFVPVRLVKDLLSTTTLELAENMIEKMMIFGQQSSENLDQDIQYQPYDYNLDDIEMKANQKQSATCCLS
ncbi:hypothetical protein RND71_043895 [Anisodus tanguticus]|uniref:Kinesin motor domain-containing protein n=1 Tax=Anisodus tanguticus TaxID=243964 RepID=A0AAE1URE1_9SOLA|nr:hypothetical protein RND71_043895 [Anisodus tanguticus]